MFRELPATAARGVEIRSEGWLVSFPRAKLVLPGRGFAAGRRLVLLEADACPLYPEVALQGAEDHGLPLIRLTKRLWAGVVIATRPDQDIELRLPGYLGLVQGPRVRGRRIGIAVAAAFSLLRRALALGSRCELRFSRSAPRWASQLCQAVAYRIHLARTSPPLRSPPPPDRHDVALLAFADGPEEARAVRARFARLGDRLIVSAPEGGAPLVDLLCAAQAAGARWIGAIEAADRLAPDALAHLSLAAGDAVAAYCDHEVTLWGVRVGASCKPDWNRELFQSWDYASPLLILRLGLAMAAAPQIAETGRAGWRRLQLAVLAETASENVTHVRTRLARRPGAPDPAPPPGVSAPAPPPNDPSVSVIVPTKDRPELLATCLGSVTSLGGVSRVEIVIVDNGTTDPDALQVIKDAQHALGAVVVHAPGPFNYSSLVNRGVAASSNEVLCLLNNDVEATDAGWLAHLAAVAARPDVGVVGPLLLFPSGVIQHAGMLMGGPMACAHVLQERPPDVVSFHGRLTFPSEFAAITGACHVTRRAVFDAVGGLDAEAFPVTYNDVDYCLKVRASGLRVLMWPSVRLIHRESSSRRSNPVARAAELRERDLAIARWPSAFAHDPCVSSWFSRRDTSLHYF